MAKKIKKRVLNKVATKRKSSTTRNTSSPKRYWFTTKRYGWGWVPATWEGWLIMAFFLLMLIPAVDSIIEVDKASHSASDTLYAAFFYITFMIVDIAVLLLVCYKTGEKPRWRWGK